MHNDPTPSPAASADGGNSFEIAGGSVLGREHRRVGRGNQDGYTWARAGDVLVAMVADGCGSGRRSEVGAHLGVRMLTAALLRHLTAFADPADPRPWQRARADVLAQLRLLVQGMSAADEAASIVAEHFLFTVVGAVITPARTAVFSIGDGIVAVNGDMRILGPYPGNRPPYLGYELLDPGISQPLEIHALRPTREIETVLLATDGAAELLQVEDCLAAFCIEDGYFRNPDAVRRRLWLLARETVRADGSARNGGLLADDTTVVSIRRKSRRLA